MSGYSSAITRIPADATGVYTQDGSLVSGTVTFNAVDRRLNSVTVKRAGVRRTRLRPRDIADLSFPSKRDLLTLAALTR
jgi:hypothetical protein